MLQVLDFSLLQILVAVVILRGDKLSFGSIGNLNFIGCCRGFSYMVSANDWCCYNSAEVQLKKKKIEFRFDIEVLETIHRFYVPDDDVYLVHSSDSWILW